MKLERNWARQTFNETCYKLVKVVMKHGHFLRSESEQVKGDKLTVFWHKVNNILTVVSPWYFTILPQGTRIQSHDEFSVTKQTVVPIVRLLVSSFSKKFREASTFWIWIFVHLNFFLVIVWNKRMSNQFFYIWWHFILKRLGKWKIVQFRCGKVERKIFFSEYFALYFLVFVGFQNTKFSSCCCFCNVDFVERKY